MNDEGLNLIKKATKGSGEVTSEPPAGDKDLPFVDIRADSPAEVLNDLYEADLLASPNNRPLPKDTPTPRLELISTAAPVVGEVVLTFFDQHSTMGVSHDFFPRS